MACASSPPTRSIRTPRRSPGMDRKAAINFARVGAQKIWAGTVTVQPNAKTGAHHHGALESVIYVVRGKARMRWGEHLEFVAEADPGDFIYVPPYVPHQEINASLGSSPRMRARAQRQRGGGREPRHRAGREAGEREVDRSDPSRIARSLAGWSGDPAKSRRRCTCSVTCHAGTCTGGCTPERSEVPNTSDPEDYSIICCTHLIAYGGSS